MSKVSRYFKILVTFALIPVNANFDEKTLSFSFLSVKFGIYSIFQIVGTVLQQITIGSTIGFETYWNNSANYVVHATATDTISLIGFGLMFSITLLLLAIFYKDLGNINY